MDHRHINQFYSHPPIQGNSNNNICPICSNSHVPFCNQNPRFPPPFNQPFIGHATDNYRGPTPPQRPGFVDSRMLGNGFGGLDWSEDERSRKRVRVGEIVSEEERRLKLIYDHGGVVDNGVGMPYVQNGGGWGVHQRPHNVVNNMVYPGNGNGAVQIQHSQNNGSGGVGFSPVPQRFASPAFNMQGRYAGNQQNMNVQLPPPLPLSPPPPIPMEPPRPFPYEINNAHQSSMVTSSVFPGHISGSPGALSPSIRSAPNEPHPGPPFLHNRIHYPNSAGQIAQTLPNQYGREEQSAMSKQWTSDKPKVIDAIRLFKPPHRETRPGHMVVILRGLPGSGKSYLAKMLRDLEVENGGEAPRIHSMDEYFMTEVEKPEEYENTKGRKTTMKKVMEYCYEPEMEEAYRSSMLKSFKKSLEAGGFTFIIVDDRNLRVAHFAQFWATAKRSGYEVYLLEAPYKDPAGCAARNVHNFTQDDIKRMAGEWEEAPSLYLQLDAKSLFHGDNLKETGIEEVDMDMENEPDSDCLDTHGMTSDATASSQIHSNDEKQGDDEVAVADKSKDLGQSKWSNDLDYEEVLLKYSGKRKTNDLSDMRKADGKKVKEVRWGDQVKDTGFSIGVAKKTTQTLIIGPGPGYNSMTNPVLTDNPISSAYRSGNKKSVFQERLRAEHESFKDVFAKRKQKLGLQDE